MNIITHFKQILEQNFNNFIKKYSSAAEARRETGVDESGIRKVCKGQRKTAGGYFWTYKKED